MTQAVVFATQRGPTMSKWIDVRELATRLDEALASAAAGDEIILTEGSTPRARLVPLPAQGARVAGLHPDAIQATPDFDAPLPDEFWSGQP